jgi:hypothetical protein
MEKINESDDQESLTNHPQLGNSSIQSKMGDMGRNIDSEELLSRVREMQSEAKMNNKQMA